MYNRCQKYIQVCYVMAFSEHIFMQHSKTHALIYANISVASKEVEHEQMTTLIWVAKRISSCFHINLPYTANVYTIRRLHDWQVITMKSGSYR